MTARNTFDAMTTSERLFTNVFRVAAFYNVLWGVTVILFPTLLFDLLNVERPNYPFLMSGIGLFVALYGYGYWVVAQDLRRYPQLVIIGFLGKTLGPIGWLFTVWRGELPARTLLVNVFNDLIWLPFFVAYLLWFYRGQRALRA